MFWRGIQRWRRSREPLPLDEAGAAIHKGCDEFRGYGAAVVVSERRIPDFVEIGSSFKCAVELSPTHPYAGLVWAARQLLQERTLESRRVRQSDPRREVVIASRGKRTW